MLTKIQYTELINLLFNNSSCSTHAPNYNDYKQYETLWESYIVNSATILKNYPNIKRLGLIAMESAPGNSTHPNPNYIFNNTHHLLKGKGNVYLRNIYNGGTLDTSNCSSLTKQECLNELLIVNDFTGNTRPIILFDLLPTHGIQLSTKIRKIIAVNNIPEMQMEINRKLNFIFQNILLPLNLKWINVHLKFACPPSTVAPNSIIPKTIIKFDNGITVHPISINQGANISPSKTNLINNIKNHGF
jgi:hypothetical protein